MARYGWPAPACTASPAPPPCRKACRRRSTGFTCATFFATAPVVREALNNAVRHGRPGRVSVRLQGENGGLRLRVRDDGCGFDPGAVSRPGAAHYGIVGMRERIESLGGSFVLESAPGRGTAIEIVLPPDARKPHRAEPVEKHG